MNVRKMGLKFVVELVKRRVVFGDVLARTEVPGLRCSTALQRLAIRGGPSQSERSELSGVWGGLGEGERKGEIIYT